MHSGRGDTPQRVPGYPIRKPPDHSLAAGSPGNIAGSSVLHRLLVPRHPPCALKNLAHTKTLHNTQRNPLPRREREPQVLDARVHCAVLKKRTAPPPPPRTRGTAANGLQPKTRAITARSLSTQQRARPAPPRLPRSAPPQGNVLAGRKEKTPVTSQRPTRKQWTPAGTPAPRGAGCSLERR
jgi:hypothetical protein